MKDLIHTIKDFKIIPNNFKSSAEFRLLEADEEKIVAELILIDEKELEDYSKDAKVEVFGVNNVGLVYFEAKIIERNDKIITLSTTNDFSIIQRREYSRVGLNQGKIIFKDLTPDFVLKVEDISAGGAKFIANQPLEFDKRYEIDIILSNNMKISCSMQPIRIKELQHQEKNAYLISGKFIDLENVDRIVLVQYTFKIKMEEQNKEND